MSVPALRLRHPLLILLLAGGVAACSSEAPPTDEAAVTAAGPVAPVELEAATARVFEPTETHADQPPHGGVVVPLGGHVAHAEVVLVPDTGELNVYLLDQEGQPGKRIAQPSVLADIETSGRSVRLDLQATPEDGERVGDASRFTGRSEDLLRTGQARITLRWILVDGQVFSDNVVDWAQ